MALERLQPSPVTGEIYLTDLIHIAREQGLVVAALVDPDQESLLGINSRAELAAATQTGERSINARHLDQGVTLIDPESALSSPGSASAGTRSSTPTSISRGPPSLAKTA